MAYHVGEVRSGDAITAEGQNTVNRTVNSARELRADGAFTNSYAEGDIVTPARYDKFDIHILTSSFTFPDLFTVSDELLDYDPTPFATAKPLALQHASVDDEDASEDPVYSYTEADGTDTQVTIYAPQQFHSALSRTGPGPDTGYAQGIAQFADGDRCLCGWNRQSGRWECVEKAETIWRFELTGTSTYVFSPGDSADALLYAYDSDADDYDPNDLIAITVYDPLSIFSGTFIYPSGGSRGWCKWMGDSGRWEILSPGSGTGSLYWGKATADWTNNSGMDTVTVQRSKRDGTVLDSTSLTVYLPVPVSLDPAVYSGNVISWEFDDAGDRIAQGMGALPLDTIIPWHKTGALPTGWVDCDATALPGDKKVSRANAPDQAEGEVLMNGGDAAFDTTVGFKQHGVAENNHPSGKAYDSIAGIAANSGGFPKNATTSDGATFSLDVGEYYPVDGNTDNRQRSLVTRFIYRYK